jgi:adenylate cyclase class IV
MASNVEIKARLAPGQAALIRGRALSLSSRPSEHLHQVDTFYRVPAGRLKLRDFGDGTGELIAYERPDRAGPSCSSYALFPCADPRALHEALARSLGVRGIVEKQREVIHVGQTRIHLDEVAGLGSFLELEVVLRDGQSEEQGAVIAADLEAALGVPGESRIEGAYIDLLEEEETPRKEHA